MFDFFYILMFWKMTANIQYSDDGVWCSFNSSVVKMKSVFLFVKLRQCYLKHELLSHRNGCHKGFVGLEEASAYLSHETQIFFLKVCIFCNGGHKKNKKKKIE